VPAAILETPRLRLRGWTAQDLDPWCELNADPRVCEFFPFPFPRERSLALAATIREELEQRGYGWWIAEIKESGTFAGSIALIEVSFEAHFTPATEIGWRLAYEHWGNGYATEGAAAALRFAFEVLGLREVVAMTAVDNVRSRRVMERLGMTHDPRDDFDHPRLPKGHPLERHVLYRARPA